MLHAPTAKPEKFRGSTSATMSTRMDSHNGTWHLEEWVGCAHVMLFMTPSMTLPLNSLTFRVMNAAWSFLVMTSALSGVGCPKQTGGMEREGAWCWGWWLGMKWQHWCQSHGEWWQRFIKGTSGWRWMSQRRRCKQRGEKQDMVISPACEITSTSACKLVAGISALNYKVLVSG